MQQIAHFINAQSQLSETTLPVTNPATDQVTAEMRRYQEEIVGPVLYMVRIESLA